MSKLIATKRELLGKKANRETGTDSLLGVIFGPKYGSVPVTINYKDFGTVFADAGYSKLVDLEVEGKKYKGIVKELQAHPVTGKYRHVSIYVVDMEKELEASIPVEITGLAPAVKNSLGFLEIPANAVTVKCLPADLPAKITVDVSNLNEVGESISLADLNLGERVAFTGNFDPSFRVAFIAAPQKVEVEPEAAPAAAEGEEGAAAPATEGEAAAE
jgi:large subunit ribosomal protein L25